MRTTDGWRPTAAHVRAVLGGTFLAVAAVLARRPDLLVFAAPFAAVATWAVVARPTVTPTVRHSLGHAVVREG
ncbi:MAG TPA: hypothetical protein VIK05_06440, partial [Ilumatobacteraceae bacterium]